MLPNQQDQQAERKRAALQYAFIALLIILFIGLFALFSFDQIYYQQ